MGINQTAGREVPVSIGAAGITIAAASNNIAKAFYGYSFSDRATGVQTFSLLSGLSVAGLIPLVWLLR